MTLEIDNAREEDNGMYECKARNLNDTVVFGKVFDVSVVPRREVDNIFISDSLENQVKVIHSLLIIFDHKQCHVLIWRSKS